MSQPEFLYVEQPALDQFQSNGWSYKDGRELTNFDHELKNSEALMYRVLKGFEI